MSTGHFCLKWNNFHNSIVTAFESLQSSEELVDVTLMCEGRNVKAHKVILSACSPYFRNLFKETPCKHPIIILKDVLHCDLIAILQFMYQGEVLVDQDGLASFLKTAELLQVSGLAGSSSSATTGIPEAETPIVPAKPAVPVIPTPEIITPARTKSPNSPKPAVVKVRNDIIPIEPVIEKENILNQDEKQSRFESIEEPMQSCSYQDPENVIIKTESTDDSEYQEMEYLEPIDDPGPTTEEQSILERSLKAQGKILPFLPQFQEKEPVKRKRRFAFSHFLFDTNNRTDNPSRQPIRCPFCSKIITQGRNLKRHMRICKRRPDASKRTNI